MLILSSNSEFRNGSIKVYFNNPVEINNTEENKYESTVGLLYRDVETKGLPPVYTV